MRLVTFTASGAQRVGAFVDDDRRIVDFAAAGAGADPAFGSMQALIEGGAAALDRARASVADAQRSGRGMVDTADGEAFGAAAGAGANARFSLLREAPHSGVRPLAPSARGDHRRSGKSAARDGSGRHL